MINATLDRRPEPIDRVPTLAIVIVNFNSWPDSERLIESLPVPDPSLSDRVEIIVVDNASAAPPPDTLVDRSGVRLVLLPDNAGFAAGVNTAWRVSDARWLLLINPDVVADPGFVPAILDRIDRLEQRPGGPPGLVGFALRNEDGSPQPSVGSFPTLAGCLRELGTPRTRRKYWPLRRTKPGPVPWVTGACLLVHSSAMADVGGMDEDFFLYHEEVALCRSARDLGWSVEFDDSVAPRHLKPLQSRAISPLLRVVTRHSKLLYFLKFRPRWEFLALSWIISVEARLRLLHCRVVGKWAEANAWAGIDRIARTLDVDHGPRGIEVHRFAERAIRNIRNGPAVGLGPAHRRSSIRLDASRRRR